MDIDEEEEEEEEEEGVESVNGKHGAARFVMTLPYPPPPWIPLSVEVGRRGGAGGGGRLVVGPRAIEGHRSPTEAPEAAAADEEEDRIS